MLVQVGNHNSSLGTFMSQGLIFIRTNVQLFLFNEVSCKTVLGTFVFYLYNACLILFLSSQLILMNKNESWLQL